jgi:hypothetical protein
MGYASTQEAIAYHSDAANSDPFKVEMILKDAADELQRYAPAPVGTVPDDYKQRAKRCELRIFQWMYRTDGGLITADRVADISENYGPDAEYQVRKVVSAVMGKYYRGPRRLRTLPLQRS